MFSQCGTGVPPVGFIGSLPGNHGQDAHATSAIHGHNRYISATAPYVVPAIRNQ